MEVPRGDQPWPERHSIAVTEARRVHDVPHDSRPIPVAREDCLQIFGGHDDLVHQAEPRVNAHSPAREVIVGLTTVVVEYRPLPEASSHQNRGCHREQERPVGRREDVDDVGATEPIEARKIEGLVE